MQDLTVRGSVIKYKIKLYRYLLILPSVLYWSCASSVPPSGSMYYKPESPLTTEVAYSLSTPLELRIPVGWFTAEDTDCKCIDLWLIRDDFSATINLVTLEAADTSSITEDSVEIKILAISKKMRAEKLAKKFIQTKEDEVFVLNDKKYAAYEFQGDEGLPIRVIVFRYENQYFELSAMPAKGVGRHPVNPQELFTVQQSVLSSIR